MASHSYTIAKASLSASLMRPDPTSIPRDQTAQFHELLDAVLTRCSPTNIQLCKAWLLKHTALSAAKVTAVGKYLVALSISLSKNEEKNIAGSVKVQKRRMWRKRLHILYLLNDLLHHTKFHSEIPMAFSTIANFLKPYVLDLFRMASAPSPDQNESQQLRISELVELWQSQNFFGSEYILTLRDEVARTITSATSDGEAVPLSSSGLVVTSERNHTPRKDIPFIMPAVHGDPSAPYYDLPAGSMMPHIIPNSATPISPSSIKPLHFIAGPADENLIAVIKDFMKNVEELYSQDIEEDEEMLIDSDELGQRLKRNKFTGVVLTEDAYYGWSKVFCENMKRRESDTANLARERNDSISRNKSLRKRRRCSPVSSQSTSRERESSVTVPRVDRKFRRGDSHSRSLSRHRQYSPNGRFRYRQSKSRSRSRSYSPPQRLPENQHYQSSPPLPPQQTPFPGAFLQGLHFDSCGIPIPPPPPPNYNGPWPPLPPPLGANGSPFQQFPAFVPPPPPQTVGGWRPYVLPGPPIQLNQGNGSELHPAPHAHGQEYGGRGQECSGQGRGGSRG